MADAVPRLIWMLGTDNVCTYVNPSAAAMLEPDARIDISSWLEFMHPEDMPRVLPALKQAMEAQEEYQFEYRILRTDGSVRWMMGSGAPRYAGDGKFLGYIGHEIDVSAKHEALEHIAKSEATHRLLTENSTDLITHHAADWSVVHVSPSITRILGYRPSELLGKIVKDTFHPEDIPLIEAEVQRQAESGGEGQVLEVRRRHKDGHYIWLASQIRVLLDPLTQQSTGVISVCRDVTFERHARSELQKREARFRSLTDLSSDWYWETDEDGRFKFVSDGAARMFGILREQFVNKTRLDIASDPDHPGIREYLEKIGRREAFRDIRYTAIAEHDGSLLHLSISGEPVFEQDCFKGYRGIGKNITSEIEVAEQLARLADENEALVENSLGIVSLLDEQGRFLRVNKALEDILGYTREEWIGRQYREFLHPDDIERTLAVDASLRTGKNTIQDFETRWLRRDGSVAYLSLSVRWSRDKQVMYATASDVTDRYHDRLELQKSRDMLDSILESIGDAFFTLDQDWRLTYLNSKAAEFAGIDPATSVGRFIWDAVPPFPESSVFPFYQRAMATRQEALFQACWEPNGCWVEVRVYPNEHGLSVYFHDITASRQAENQLRKSEQRFKNLFEQAGDCILIADIDMRILDANQQACRALGYTREELLQLSVPDIEMVSDQHKDVLDDLRAGQTRLIRAIKLRKDGSTFPAEVQIARFEEESKEYFQAIVRDVTERDAAQRLVAQSEQRFREMISMTPSGYLVADGSGVLVEVNEATCALSGFAREELLGHDMGRLFAFCPWKGVAFVPGGPRRAHGMEAVIRSKSGRDVHVLLNAIIKRDADDNAVSLTAFMTDISDRKQAEQRLQRLATHDTLTGLPNRAFLNTHVQQMLDSAPRNQSVAVLFIDLDRFKEVNDSFGHEPGDTLLCEVAERLRRHLRPGDFVARLGGDEFVVTAYCSVQRASAAAIAEKLLHALSLPIQVAGHEVYIGASIGISMFPGDGESKELLFQSADTAMYRAKAAGRNRYCFFETEMSVEARTRMSLASALRHALEGKQFCVHYQPRVDLKTMTVSGMEALIRWNHPELGQVPPLQFIPIAEESGLIESIGHWVLEQACVQTRRMMATCGRPLRISVNLSARQLKSPHIVERVRSVLSQTRLPPHLLELELTESMLIDDMEQTAEVLRDLKALGLRLSVDDFGTGYSGLAYLRKFPLDILKLDRSFVRQKDETTASFEFIKAFVDLAHTLKMSVVAEGVESDDILQFLRNARCDEAQGFFLSKPLAADAFEAYLCRWPGAVA